MERCDVCGEDLFFPKVEILGRTMAMRRKCRCVRESEERESKRRQEEETTRAVANARAYCFREYADYRGCTFDSDDMNDPKMHNKLVNYAANFGRFMEEGSGLLFFGNVGAGKTFYSACIANALLDEGRKVMMSNLVSLVHRIQKESFSGLDVMREIERCDLLIIDDLGVERDSSYMREHVYGIIDARYRSGKPMIVSTNLTGDELKAPTSVSDERIYGRILERCLPMRFDGPNRRKGRARYRDMLEVMNGEQK